MSLHSDADERRPLIDGSDEGVSASKTTYSSATVVPADESPSTSENQDGDFDIEATKERHGNARMAKLVRDRWLLAWMQLPASSRSTYA